MSTLEIVAYVYLGLGLLYALWVWLFKGSSIFSIPLNTIFGPAYILGMAIHFVTWKKPTIYKAFQDKEAVIFDLDGTIVDDQPQWDEAIENVKERTQLGLERNYPSGLNVRAKWEQLLSAMSEPAPLSIDELVRATKDEFLRLSGGLDVRDGFWTFARYLKEKGFKIALASNTDRDVVDILVERLEIGPVFDVVVAGDEVKSFKPAPDIYLEAAKRLGVKPREVVAFEDSVVGAESAVAAGIETIIVWDGVVSKLLYPSDARLYVEDFDGLDDMVEKTGKQRLEEAAAAIEAESSEAETAV